MCGPCVHLSPSEKYQLRRDQEIAILLSTEGTVADVGIAHFDSRFGNVAVNMRRLERLENPPGPLAEAKKLVDAESPTRMGETRFGVFPGFNGITERRRPDDVIMVPPGFRLAGIAQIATQQGYLVTIGPRFAENLAKIKPDSKSLGFYEHVFRNHGGNPRSPIIVASQVQPSRVRTVGVPLR